ncbi:flagellar assembly peptidoglycan hydrolase FlgJ [Shewanella maritima]|uniref:flagellar assembly peptidoglycan hydrolase FlgJ n=1 Tax=Shewanella maritima TaxID=2520507 RepID=UPI003736E645
MEKLSNSSNFLDLGGLDSLRTQAQKDEKGALEQAAKQFEGIFIQMLMKSMRDANAAFKSDSPLNSDTTEFFEQMRDQQMSVDLSQKGMLGLAELMVQQLDPQNSDVKPASMLRDNYNAQAQMSIDKLSGFQMPSRQSPLQQQDIEQAKLDVASLAQGDEIALSHNILHTPAVQANQAKDDMQQILAGKVMPSQVGNSLPHDSRVSVKESQFESPEHFVSVLYPHAKKAAESLGTTPDVLIAQSALETGWGQKVIRQPDGDMSNNLFNIKADGRWQGDKATVSTLEYEQGVAVRQQAEFRVYDSIEQSFNDFVDFISQSERYQQARDVAASPAKFIHALQQAGYATDPQYANKVLRVMNSVTESIKPLVQRESE